MQVKLNNLKKYFLINTLDVTHHLTGIWIISGYRISLSEAAAKDKERQETKIYWHKRAQMLPFHSPSYFEINTTLSM